MSLDPPAPRPESIAVRRGSRVLELRYAGGEVLQIPFELLRVYSPSAEVRGHGPGQETLQTGKREVDIVAVDPVGHYAIQPRFSDGHDSGIYTWEWLLYLGRNQNALWADYLARLQAAGLDRDTPMPAPATGDHACGHH